MHAKMSETKNKNKHKMSNRTPLPCLFTYICMKFYEKWIESKIQYMKWKRNHCLNAYWEYLRKKVQTVLFWVNNAKQRRFIPALLRRRPVHHIWSEKWTSVVKVHEWNGWVWIIEKCPYIYTMSNARTQQQQLERHETRPSMVLVTENAKTPREYLRLRKKVRVRASRHVHICTTLDIYAAEQDKPSLQSNYWLGIRINIMREGGRKHFND